MLELERAEKWEEARAMLYELWNADRENIDSQTVFGVLVCVVRVECSRRR